MNRILSRSAITAFVAALALATTAQAGDVLRLKRGTVRPAEIERNWDVTVKSDVTRTFVVQFRQPITLGDRQNLMSLGAKILRYIPDDALVVAASSKIAKTIEQSSPAVSSVISFEPEWKVSPEIMPASVFSAKSVNVYHVRLFPGLSSQAERQIREKIASVAGVEVLESQERSMVIRAPRVALEAVTKIEMVEWVQRQPTFETLAFNDDEVRDQAEATAGDYGDLDGYESGTKIMKFDSAWTRGYTGRGQIVAMADTGLDSGDASAIHPDFSNKVTKGLVFGLFSKSWGDPMGHGTHVAGSILGSGAKSGGPLKGAAYDAHIVAESLWSPMLGGLSVPSKMGDLFGQAYDLGARVHTNSWGSAASVGQYDAFAQQTDEFNVAHPDMLILFAAGNSGVDADKDGRIDSNSIGSPGTAKNVLTVGASENLVSKGGIQKMMKELRNGATNWGVEPIASSKLSDNPQGIAAFSSRGPTADGRIKPEIVAPGTNILAARSQMQGADVLWGAYNDAYVWSGGTSMSTPLTAGAAAVVRQYLVESRKIAQPSGALMKAALIHTATDLFPGQFGSVGKSRGQELITRRPNNDEGYGRVDVQKATNLEKALIVDEKAGLATGEAHKYSIKVSDSAHLIATLVYTDAAGSSAAAKALVNDLDLQIVNKADGSVVGPNDKVNNHEMIETSAERGEYEVLVRGANVPQGPQGGKQPYALVISVE